MLFKNKVKDFDEPQQFGCDQVGKKTVKVNKHSSWIQN
jgi:hypothetical protein